MFSEPWLARSQWIAINDHGSGPLTGPNVTRYNVFGNEDGAAGPLKDVISGAVLPVTLTISRSGAVGTEVGGVAPPVGSPLASIFDGFIDFNSSSNHNNCIIGRSPPGVVTYTLSGLDPYKDYILQGGAVRGDPTYTNRWTLFELSGAEESFSAHSAGALTTAQVDTIATNQVAINTGANHLPGTGDMFQWERVRPGADGMVEIICRRYDGTVPGGSSDGYLGYSLTALRITEAHLDLFAPEILIQPNDQAIRVGESATFAVSAIAIKSPLFYQWFRNENPILGATNRIFAITNAMEADDGSAFSVVVSNEVGSVTSDSALLSVTLWELPLAMRSGWKYEVSGVDLGYAWREPNFDDAAWLSGPGPFGFGTAALPEPIRTQVPNHYDFTFYFRTRFVFPHDPGDYQLVFTNLIDDGAVFYLNNRELIRVRLPDGAINFHTRASESVGNAQFETVTVPSHYLLEGTNCLAVEVHQTIPFHYDMVLGVHVEPVGTVAPTLTITNQPQDLELVEGQTASFEVGLSGGARYQWFKDDLAIPGANGFELILPNLELTDAGRYWITASNRVNTVTSRVAVLTVDEPVAVIITRQPTNETVSVGAPVLLSATVEGSAPRWLQWFKDGEPVPGATEQDLSIPSAFLGDAGVYHLSASNIAGSDTSSQAVLTVLSVPTGGPGTVDTNFNASPNSIVRDVRVLPNGQILVGGFFDVINNVSQRRVARLHPDGSLDRSFQPRLQADSIYAVTPLPDGKLLIGGKLEAVEGIWRIGIARLNADGSLDGSFDPGSGFGTESWKNVRRIVVQPDDRILVSGEFTSYNGVPRNYIARLLPDGSLDTSFDPGTGANNTVRALALLPDGNMLIGGFFTQYNGADQRHIARLFPDGSLDPSFLGGTNGADGDVYFITLTGSHILVSGAFTSLAGVPLGKVARLEMDGTPDPDFHFAVGVGGSYVYTVTEQPYGHLVIGGYFDTVHGVPVNHAARLRPDGSLDPCFDQEASFGASAGVLTSALLPDGDLLLGGTFTRFAGRRCLVKVVGDSGPVLQVKPLERDRHQICWLTNHAEGFVLQSRSNLTEGIWHDTSLAPTQTNRYHAVTMNPSNSPQFYRLTKP